MDPGTSRWNRLRAKQRSRGLFRGRLLSNLFLLSVHVCRYIHTYIRTYVCLYVCMVYVRMSVRMYGIWHMVYDMRCMV